MKVYNFLKKSKFKYKLYFKGIKNCLSIFFNLKIIISICRFFFQMNETLDPDLTPYHCICFLGRLHVTDYSNASTTGIFDSYQVRCMSCLFTVSVPFPCCFHITVMWLFSQMCWSQLLCTLVSLPLSIFPKVENTGWVNPFSFPYYLDLP